MVVNTREAAPREFYIKKKDVEAHGHTRGCPGCRTMFQGGTRQAHTAECRERFRGLMRDEEKVKRTQEKRKEYEEKMEEKELRKEAKRKRKEERRGRKRGAEDDDIEEERIREETPEEERGHKRKAEGGELEQERDREQAAASSEDMAIELVTGDAGEAWDDVKGGRLDRREVEKARAEEVGYMKKLGLWEVVPRERAQGSRPVSVKWVDTNKGSEAEPLVRSRLVARDFRVADKDREDLFAATPPWELKKLLMSQAANRGGGKLRKILLIDVKKAHLNPECKEDVYVELPEEAGEGPDKVGKLRRWLYGFRPAAAAWENHYAEKLQSVGFRRGLATPVSFYHKEKDLSLVVHGDDFTFVGEDSSLNWIARLMMSWYEVKVRARLGSGAKDDKVATLLGRVIRWNDWGISCEADPKHRGLVMEALRLEEHSKSLVAPGSKEKAVEDAESEGQGGDTKFRAVVARLNYMAADMPDIQFACKEACREMAAPTSQSWAKVKRLGRYLVGRPRVVWKFPWKENIGDWRVYTDSDWAGDTKTRKSTSGGLILLGDHCLKTWSSSQDAIALSSCEAEYYAVVEGATRAIGMQNAAKELGMDVKDMEVEMCTDSSAAKSFASKRGSGRVKHIDTKWLWLQSAVAGGRFSLKKVKGSSNPADVCTKYLTISDAAEKLRAVNIDVEAKSSKGPRSGGSSWVKAEPRLKWADAEDTEDEIASAAVGACEFCGSWADECLRQSSEEECRDGA